MNSKAPTMLRITILRLIPNVRFGRWLTALIIAVIGLAIFGLAGFLVDYDAERFGYYFEWPPALFFISAVAYIVPVFHFITERSFAALDDLAPHLDDSVSILQLRTSIEQRTRAWHLRCALFAVLLWLVQSYMLAGSFRLMWFYLTDGYVSFVMSVGSLFVWLAMVIAMRALADNARLFGRLSADLRVDVLNPASYRPIGQMAISSTLVVLGAQALLPIMWMDGTVSIWTTLPAVILFLPLLLYLTLVPTLPLRRELRTQKGAAIAAVQQAINALPRPQEGLNPSDVQQATVLMDYRQHLNALPEGPFDFPAIVRFSLYAIVVPLTWAGAAIIEIFVNMILGT